jgi:transcriptional regulator with XRE-family HTH domain
MEAAMDLTESIWGKRLKEARLAAGISQKTLGIQAGLDPSVASTRINRYELGVHKADYKIAQLLSRILHVPTGYFYTEDDQLAELILIAYRLPLRKRSDLLKYAASLAG